MTSIYDHKVESKSGEEVSLKTYEGKVLLIVNTASQCGFTPQYAGLQKLHEDLADRGLQVLGFPCNQFGRQEPGDNDQIQSFCQVNYGVSFPIFGKLRVNGNDAHPLFRFLKKQAKGLLGTEAIKWNFTKFLIDRQGNVLGRFGPSATPKALRSKIEAVL
ncbi:MAG: glutathione peroxidase [Myxococcota bacterium]